MAPGALFLPYNAMLKDKIKTISTGIEKISKFDNYTISTNLEDLESMLTHINNCIWDLIKRTEMSREFSSLTKEDDV